MAMQAGCTYHRWQLLSNLPGFNIKFNTWLTPTVNFCILVKPQYCGCLSLILIKPSCFHGMEKFQVSSHGETMAWAGGWCWCWCRCATVHEDDFSVSKIRTLPKQHRHFSTVGKYSHQLCPDSSTVSLLHDDNRQHSPLSQVKREQMLQVYFQKGSQFWKKIELIYWINFSQRPLCCSIREAGPTHPSA